MGGVDNLIELGSSLVDEVLCVHRPLRGVGRLEDCEGDRRAVVLGLQHPRLQPETALLLRRCRCNALVLVTSEYLSDSRYGRGLDILSPTAQLQDSGYILGIKIIILYLVHGE